MNMIQGSASCNPFPMKRRTQSVVLLYVVLLIGRTVFLFEPLEPAPDSIDVERRPFSGTSSAPHTTFTDLHSSQLPETTMTDWFNETLWQANPFTRKCVVLHNVCHTSRQWFVPSSERLPNVLFNNMFSGSTGYPTHIRLSTMHNNATMSTCHESPIPNHMVLHGRFVDMLGEFYARILHGFFTLLNHDNIKPAVFAASTQLYLHLRDASKHILDSHIVFTEPWRQTDLLDFKSLLHNTHCQCLPRLIMCGYQEQGWSRRDFASKQTRIQLYRNETTTTNVTPSSGLATPDGTQGNWNGLRQALRDNVIHNNKFVLEAIQLQREAYLEQVLGTATFKNNSAEWTIVGLAQRHGRRRWQNLNESLALCNEKLSLFAKTICVSVLVDDDVSNPFWQVARHGALDGLVGIHGAQLTEGIWMRPKALMVELLPFVPDTIKTGQWTRWTNRPTPLGVIFHETDLNHVGYPLTRNSLLDCQEVMADTKSLVECYRQTSWDNRDFLVAPVVLVQALTRLMPLMTNDDGVDCQEWHNRSEADYVLYNINCRSSNDTESQPHHFYWKR